MRGWALALLRIVVGFGFAAHGWAKLERGPERFAALLDAMGFPAPDLFAWATTLIELVGGASIMLGAFVVPLAAPLAAIMIVAMAAVHARYGFSSVRLQAFDAAGARFGPVGYEVNLLYLAGLAALAAAGPGRLSFDGWRARRRAARKAAGGGATGS